MPHPTEPPAAPAPPLAVPVPTPVPARAGRREWLGLAVLALPALLVALDIGVLFLALPQLSADLGASATHQLWITDSYGFLLAGFLVTMGTLGDRIGRRRLLLVSAAAFGLASVAAAFATGPAALIAARALLGIAGAGLGPSTLALISSLFRDDRQRGLAISIWATCQFAGAGLGPVVGGVLLERFWWGSAFLLGVPVMVLLLVLGPVLLPEHRDPVAGRVDLPSVVLSLLAILPVVWSVKQLAVGSVSAAVPAAVTVGLAAGAGFVRRQARLAHPLVDLALLRDRRLGGALLAMAGGSAALAGTSLLTTQYIQTVVGLGPAEAGLWQAPTGLGIATGVLLAPLLTRRLAPPTTILAGLAVAGAGLLLLTRVADGSPAPVAAAIALVALGVGPLFALGTGLVVGSAPVARAGAAASLSETGNILGSSLGLALLGSLGAAVYRARLDAPPGAPAGETVAAATAEAAGLPAGPAAELLAAAHSAFTDGLSTVAAVAAVLVAAVALLVRRTS